MSLVIFLVVVFACILSVECRLMLLHPIKTIKYLTTDLYHYFHDRKYNRYDGGMLNCYFAHFGGGKTLSVVHYIRILFHKYNNKRIYDRQQKKWVLQKIHIISNVHLKGVPYEELTSLSQVVCCAWRNKKIDEKQGTRTCVIVLLDEASSELNSRNFKSNIDANFLNTLITSRHFNMSLYYTSQKFKLVDALLRSVTQRCIWCDKRWRFMVQHFFDADEMEYATNPTMVQPLVRKGFFITDKDFDTYDTLATVERLDKDTKNGAMMTEEEILAMRGVLNPDNDQISRPSRKLKRVRKSRSA